MGGQLDRSLRPWNRAALEREIEELLGKQRHVRMQPLSSMKVSRVGIYPEDVAQGRTLGWPRLSRGGRG